MITEHDLREAIAECEGQRNPTSSTCIKLAAFYTILEKMYPDPIPTEDHGPVFYSRTAGYTSDTEFGRLVSGLTEDRLMSVMDELMSTLQILYPRLYASVIRELEN